ncbi:murein L,D-transpeptidase [Altererythrobacter sp. HHU K3-1]|uniref:Murein L,D-transpeptidase n=2 Tax=Qipengyuania atrilutea TaxID=2744473 RepID=A0A850H168_9SPHN|nr:murein L,D-transpeptidase [Actirhodobacter atriluteus]
MNGTDRYEDEQKTAEADTGSDLGYETYSDDNEADTMASNDAAFMNASASGDNEGTNGAMTSSGNSSSGASDTMIEDPEDRPIMQAQVVLDRRGFGPGVIDGKMGMSTENALMGFQEANGLDQSGELDEATKEALSEWERIPATRVVTVPQNWAQISYTDIPESTEAKAELQRLGYKSIDEKLAERFHTTLDVLRRLNPNGRPAGMEASGSSASSTPTPSPTPSGTASGSGDAQAPYFTAGQQIRVPNIGADRIEPGAVSDKGWQQTLAALGVGTEQTEVDRIVVSKAGKTLKAYQGDKLVALFTVSSGSSQFPLPLGEWDIVGEAYLPPYRYDPEVLGNEDAEGEVYELPPGPNSPVGVVWIDLSKEHYGIHGTPDPETIGRAQSSGCVRLTNWDAARLAGMVTTSTEVLFEA